jgi:hypothetical protein
MKRLLLLTIAFCITTPSTLAQQLPPPQNPAEKSSPASGSAEGPALINPATAIAPIPPQRVVPQKAAAANAPQQNPGKPPEFFAARRQAQIDRKAAAKQRMRDFQAARAAEQEKLYQDWHERYLADTPVRVEYYRALASAYEAEAALAYSTPYFYNAAPAIVLVPIYTPIYQPATYGTYFHWGW